MYLDINIYRIIIISVLKKLDKIMTACVIITRRAQRILKGTIKIEPTCSQRLHVKVNLVFVGNSEIRKQGRGVIYKGVTCSKRRAAIQEVGDQGPAQSGFS